VGNLLNAVKSSDVIQSVNTRGQTAVKAEYLVVDESSEGQVIEQICEVFPDVGIAVFSKALVVEAIDLGNLPRLVVSAKNGDALGVSDLEGDKQRDSLNRVIASVDVIT
jgi:hypothetical protein